MRLVRLVAAEPVDLFSAVHRVPEVQARAQLQVARLEHPFEQQDGAAPAQRAQALRLVQIEQGETVGRAQGVEHPFDAMAVGIGLDHRPDPRIGRRGAGPRQVVRQRVGVDQGFDRTGHRMSLLWRDGRRRQGRPAGWPDSASAAGSTGQDGATGRGCML